MVKREFTFPSADGKTAIHAVEWLPEGAPRAVLQIAHGVSEYVLRYEDFAGYLTERGFAVVGNDHLGHGLSVADGAPRLYFGPKGSWNWVVEDMEQLRKLTHEKFPNLPYFLLGHSMGSFLTRTYLIRYPGTVDGAIIIGHRLHERRIHGGQSGRHQRRVPAKRRIQAQRRGHKSLLRHLQPPLRPPTAQAWIGCP